MYFNNISQFFLLKIVPCSKFTSGQILRIRFVFYRKKEKLIYKVLLASECKNKCILNFFHFKI